MPEPEPEQKNNKQKSKKNDIQILEYFEPLRVVIDTCVFVSAKIGKSHENFPLQVINKWREENFFLITSEKILAEVILKLDKKFNYPRKEILDCIDEIYCSPNALVLEDWDTNVFDPIDPNDNMLVSASYQGNANYLVSSDKRVLNQKQYQGTTIINVNNFLAELQRIDFKKDILKKEVEIKFKTRI